jgi:hypothetical protein
MRFNTFNEVASWYERTKPMVSKYHTKEADVRPVGVRRRKWERIKKIDDNTYALVDGNYGNTVWSSSTANDHLYENTMAPITWMRRDDGDYIRIRNHSHGHSAYTRYEFLKCNLPSVMFFDYNQQGKHWVRYKGEDIVLPKSRVAMDYSTSQRPVVNADDETYLLFRANEDGTFTRVGEKLKVEVKTIDKELKKNWHPRIHAFYNYCGAIAPVLDLGWQARAEYVDQIKEYLTEAEKVNPHPTRVSGIWIRGTDSLPKDFMRAVVSDEEHPMRVAVASMVINEIHGKRTVNTKEDLQSIKAAYNRVMNKVMGFYKVEEK